MKRKFDTVGNAAAIKIKGKFISRPVAKMFYRCEECLGKLEYFGAGVRCIASPDHFGLIHQDQAAEIERQRIEKQDQIETAYEVVGGIVVYKEQ